jgi:hypothetical protein
LDDSNKSVNEEQVNASPSQQLLVLTREMFECAKMGDWERLASLEQSRLHLFNEVFSMGISGNEALAREILSVDENTMALAKAGVPALQRELLSMRNSGIANNAYQAVQRSSSADDLMTR